MLLSNKAFVTRVPANVSVFHESGPCFASNNVKYFNILKICIKHTKEKLKFVTETFQNQNFILSVGEEKSLHIFNMKPTTRNKYQNWKGYLKVFEICVTHLYI